MQGVQFTIGEIEEDSRLILESLMPQDGVIFSDGIEADFLQFNSGTTAEISLSPETATLVVPH